MKLKRNGRLGLLSFVQRSLIVCLITLGLIILAGTVYGVIFRTDPATAQNADPNQRTHAAHAGLQGSAQIQVFTGLGRLRISTADPEPGMVIIFVSFDYDSHDRAFSEELALRLRELRDVVRSYIGSFSLSEIQMQDEVLLRAELLRRMNTILRLGQIETLFFNEFTVL